MKEPDQGKLLTHLLHHLKRECFRRVRLEEDPGGGGLLTFSADNDASDLALLRDFVTWACKKADLRSLEVRLHPYWLEIHLGLDKASSSGQGIPPQVVRDLEGAVRRGILVRPVSFHAPGDEPAPQEPATEAALGQESPTDDPRETASEATLPTLEAAETLLEDGEVERALQAADALLGGADLAEATAARLHFVKGQALQSLGRLDEGEEALSRAVSLAPEQALYRYDLALCLTSRKEFERALAEYATTLLLAPNHVDAAHNAAWVCVQMERLVEARRYFKTFLALEEEGERAVAVRQALDDLAEAPATTTS